MITNSSDIDKCSFKMANTGRDSYSYLDTRKEEGHSGNINNVYQTL